ncbi:MAG: PqqD family protein [Elusimicrobiota bacterium]
MAKKTTSTDYKHAAHVAWRRVENEGVILDLNSSNYFSLNDVGVLIWEKLGSGESLESVQAAVCEEFDVPPDQALRDIKALVKELTGKGLLLPA